MNRIDDANLLAKTTERLNAALAIVQKGEDPQFVFVEALVPLQLHMQRSALLHAQADPEPNALGWSPEQIEDAIKLIDDWLARLTGDNIVEAYEAEETMRSYYSPYRLLLNLQDIEQKKKQLMD